MSITDRSYNSINKILEKLEASQSELTLRVAKMYIKSILADDEKDRTSVRCWDCGYQLNYILFTIDTLSGEVSKQIAELKGVLKFDNVTVNYTSYSEDRRDLHYDSDNAELEMLAPLVNAITPLMNGLNNVMSQYQNSQSTNLLEEAPVAETVD